MDGDAYDHRLTIDILPAINHNFPMDSEADDHRLPIAMLLANNHNVPMVRDAYDHRLPMAMLPGNNHNFPMVRDAYGHRLPIAMGRASNHNIPMDGDAYNQLIFMRHPENHNVPALADISQLESDYSSHSKYIIRCLSIYSPFQAGVLTTVFYVPQKTEGCEIWRWCPLILSSLASIVMIALYIQYLVQQFGRVKKGRQLQERRDLQVEMFRQNWRIRLFSTNGGRTVFQEATGWWTAQNIAFLLMLIAFSVFLTLSCTHLLC